MELRKWQEEAYHFFWDNGGTALFEASTGSGKTAFTCFLIKSIMQKNQFIKTLIVVPKNVILEKTWIPELYKMGFTMKDVGIVNSFCKEYNRITITTMASVDTIDLANFQVLVADEVHHCGTARLLKLLRHKFNYKIGLSATVERQDLQHWKIKEAFDYNVYKYSLEQGIYDGVINKFNLVNVILELDNENRERYDAVTLNIGSMMASIGGFDRFMSLPANNERRLQLMSLMDKRKKLIWDYEKKKEIVASICEEHKGQKIIVFSQFNNTTNALYYYLGSCNIRAGLIHSNLGSKEKTAALNDFKNSKFNVLLSTKMLDEGYNLPEIEVGIILAGESTKIQTIQRMGRILRKKESISTLYQMYIKDTFEERDVLKKTKMIMPLAESFKEMKI